MKKISIYLGLFSFLFISLFSFNNVAYADHSWDLLHWARMTPTFTLKLGDNVSRSWDSYLVTTSKDWSLSSILDTVVVSGQSNPRYCNPVWGRVEVCNFRYGATGWLGVAQVWVTGGNHITQATTKLNDTYFSTSPYNTPAWKNLVMCQEVGHTFGLDHQDEDFYNANLGTCMDYTTNPSTNQHPNAHDYAMLQSIYAHLDEGSTVSLLSTSSNGNNIDTSNQKDDKKDKKEDLEEESWGKAIKKDKKGKNSKFERDLGNGEKVITHVFWVE